MADQFYQPQLVECTAGCGQVVSVDAKSCPNCGDPDPARIGGMTEAEIAWQNTPAVQEKLREDRERREAEWRRSEEKRLSDKRFNRWFQIVCGGVLAGCIITIYRAESLASVAISLVVGFFMIQGLLNSSDNDD